MDITRRLFLKNGGIALASIGFAPVLGPAFLRQAAFGAEIDAQKRKKTLVCIFQRGAADGLNIVVPHGDPDLYRLRPNLAVPRPGLLYKLFRASHPPIGERVDAINAYCARTSGRQK